MASQSTLVRGGERLANGQLWNLAFSKSAADYLLTRKLVHGSAIRLLRPHEYVQSGTAITSL